MLRELIHLARHAPETLSLKRTLDQAELYDTVITRADDAGFRARRTGLVSDLRGDVLEIGCGTGFMFDHYGSAARVVAIDTEEAFLDRARARIGERSIDAMHADAQKLPFPDASFDAVVACLVFCSIPDARAAFAEAKRVLRPGAELRMIEHVRSDHAISAALMNLADPIWLRLNEQGCHMNRDTLSIARSIFDHVDVTERFQIFSAGLPAFPMLTLRAH
jgi:ubiquinone/menaquinone biosynthesis C-methylase UbiE